MSKGARGEGRAAPTTEIAGTVVRLPGTWGPQVVVIHDGPRNVRLPISLLTFCKADGEVEEPEIGETYDIHLPEWLARNEGLI